jgi:hypothetical protein
VTIQYDGDDPVRYVVSVNLHRRYITPDQRAFTLAQDAQKLRGSQTIGGENFEHLAKIIRLFRVLKRVRRDADPLPRD